MGPSRLRRGRSVSSISVRALGISLGLRGEELSFLQAPPTQASCRREKEVQIAPNSPSP